MAKALLENKEFNGKEIVVERPDGSRRVVLTHANPFHDESGRITGAVNVLVDITDQRNLDEKMMRLVGIVDASGDDTLSQILDSIRESLDRKTSRPSKDTVILKDRTASFRHSEEELADFFNNAVIGLHWVGPDGIILRANQAELDVLGYAKEEYIGHHVAEFHADQEVIEDILRRLKAGETIHNYEARLRCKDGTIKPVLIDSNVRWHNGQFVHTRCFTRDISDRKMAEDALKTVNCELESRVAERTAELRRTNSRLSAEHSVVAVLANAGSFKEAIPLILKSICVSMTWEIGECWLVDKQAAVLRYGKTWQRSPRQKFEEASRQMAFPPGLGLPGRIWATRKAHWVPDLTNDTNFLRIAAAIQEGLRSGLGIPIRHGDEILGVLDFFSPAITQPDQPLLQMLESIGSQVGQFVIRKQAQETIRQSEALKAAILNSALDAIITMDSQGNVVEFNAEAERMFGYQRGQTIGKKVADLIIPPQLRQQHSEGLRRYLATGESRLLGKRVEVSAMRADGSEFSAEVALARTLGSEPPLFTGYVRDVTERKQGEKALAAAQDRLQHVVASSPAVLYMLEVEGDTIRPGWVSDNVQEMMGYTIEEAHDPNWWREHVHPDDLERVIATVHQDLFTNGHVANEYRFLHRDGSYRWVRSEMRLLRNAAGRPCEISGSWSDINERKHLEEQYRQAQKMEGIGRLAGGVAHDFNNLLTVINGYSEMLHNQPRLDEPTKKLLREIHKAGDRAAGLTQQLLAFSRKQILQPKVLDLNAILLDVEKMLRRMIGEDVELTVIPCEDLGRVMADPGQIEQVLINLAVNARDAMPQGGKLTLECGNVFLDKEYTDTHPEVTPGPYVRLAVADTGCGMDKQTQTRIFEPFFTTKEQGKGTGLGLATVYGIVKQSGGHVEVYSNVGIGTTFKIYLPALEPSLPSGKSHPGVRVMPTGTETLLLAEDEDGVRGLAKHALESCGYSVLEAKEGAEALEIAARQTEPIHLLVTDIVMPRMSGREVAERLRTTKPGIKVLYLSGYTDDAVVRHGIIAAEHDFLQKPFTPCDLAIKVREVLDK